MTDNDPLLLKPPQAAKMLGISERTLWSWKTSGMIPFVTIGRNVRYPLDGLRSWVRRNTQGGVTP